MDSDADSHLLLRFLSRYHYAQEATIQKIKHQFGKLFKKKKKKKKKSRYRSSVFRFTSNVQCKKQTIDVVFTLSTQKLEQKQPVYLNIPHLR